MIIIKTLIEDTTNDCQLQSEHGLSLYIECSEHRMLFDVGGSSQFIENAKIMGVDLMKVDTVGISHGHQDHGGGLEAFLSENQIAKIYIHRHAFDPHFSKRGENWVNIGLDPKIQNNPRIILVDHDFQISSDILIFTGVNGTRYVPAMNRNLYEYRDLERINDNFSHEINLLMKDHENTVLVIGCAHKGVVNILDHVSQHLQTKPNWVIGGFHMSSQALGNSESGETIQSVAQELKQSNAQFYTGHCTGDVAFQMMKKTMGNQLQKIATGVKLIIKTEENE